MAILGRRQPFPPIIKGLALVLAGVVVPPSPPPPPPAVAGPTVPSVAPPPVAVPSVEVRGVPPVLSRQGRDVDSPPNVPVLGLFVAPRPDSAPVRERGAPTIARPGQVRVGDGALTLTSAALHARTPPAPIMVPAVVATSGASLRVASAPFALPARVTLGTSRLHVVGKASAYAWRPLTEDELLVALWQAFEDQS